MATTQRAARLPYSLTTLNVITAVFMVLFHAGAVAAQDAEHAGEPEAAAAPLGREERIEDAGADLLVHAAAGVADLEDDELAGDEPVALKGGELFVFESAGGNRVIAGSETLLTGRGRS